MVYKKYIIRNGRTYGPYIYHSKRVDGKVVSEYRGHGNKLNFKKVFLIILGVFFVFTLAYLMSLVGNKSTGQVVLELDANYVDGEPLTGDLRISLKQGELLPASSKIVFENSNQTADYILSDIISDNANEGVFYVQGKQISGSGSGYGIEGTKTIYPEVSFVLNILSQSDSSKNKEKKEKENLENNASTETGNSADEEINVSQEIPEEQETTETISETVREAIQETQTETNSEASEKIQTTEQEETILPEISEETTSNEAFGNSIAGNVISKLFNGFFGFLGLRSTGQVSLEIDSLISGTTSVDKPFSYALSEEQTVELVSSSQNVEINIENGIVSVTTDYSETKTGFGEDYAGDKTKLLEINLEDLNFIPVPGQLNVKLIYGEDELLFITTNLIEGEVVNANITTQQNVSLNKTAIVNVSAIDDFNLTSSEIDILLKEFGNLSVETTRAEIFNNRVVVKFEIGKYWIEYSYDFDLTDSALASSIEKDRIKWLKDLAVKFSEKEKEPKQIENLLGTHEIIISSQEEQNNTINKSINETR